MRISTSNNFSYLFFLGNFGYDTDISDRNSGFCPQNNVQCKCKDIFSCSWVTKEIKNIQRLPLNHPIKKKLIKFIGDLSCGSKFGVIQKVYCCDDKKDMPMNCQLKKIKNGNFGNKTDNLKNEGNTNQVKDDQFVQNENSKNTSVADIKVNNTFFEVHEIDFHC